MKLIGMIMSLLITINVFPDSFKDHQLVKMVEVAKQQEISITEWKIYSRESVKHALTKEESRKEISNLLALHDAYTWNTEGHQGNDHYKLIGQKKNPSSIMNEQAIVTVYKDGGNYRISLAYEISGKEWSNETWDYLKSSYKDQINDHSTYYTIYGTKNYNKTHEMDVEAQATSILESLSSENVEEVKENHFISVSAYVKDWEMKIPTKNDKVFNLQVGLRMDPVKEQMNVAIGTPIITTGY
jgi:hypothetical protein